MDAKTQSAVDEWLNGPYDEETKKQIKQLSSEELVDAFYKRLEFGTGGLRGLMGPGTNRMNAYTVRAATQGLANYILHAKISLPSVVIGYDSRHHSRMFAEEAAKVLAAAGIRVYFYAELRPVPMVSFACRHLKTTAGIMVTASHNPPQYNGYKVYWSDGCQVLPPHDVGIIAEVNKITSPTQVKEVKSINHDLITRINEDEALDKAYLNAVHSYPFFPEEDHHMGKRLKIVYTSLYGTGITMVPKALAQWGFHDLHFVQEQIVPNGDFPTTPFPNPEEREALQLGLEKLKSCGGDLLIATDPDCDRMGIATLDNKEPVLFTGNEIVCLAAAHILERGHLPKNPAFIKTIVTSELFATLVKAHDCACFNVLTGFKYIGQLMTEWEKSHEYHYIFGGEESYGSLLGTHARDKDAIIASALIAEVALHAKLQGKTLTQKLHDLYAKYGVFREKLTSLTFPGKAGADQMAGFMKKLRDKPPAAFGGSKIVAIDDYQTRQHTEGGKKTPISLPVSNVLVFWLEDGSRLVIRPSGTEPKIKLYGEVKEPAGADLNASIAKADKRLAQLLDALKNDLK